MSGTPVASANRQQITRDTILAAEARLQRASFPELRGVYCTFCDGVLTVAGSVPSEFFRELAPRVVHGLDHVETIENNVVVVTRNARRQAGSLCRQGRAAFLRN
jgi:hypothetical protein